MPSLVGSEMCIRDRNRDRGLSEPGAGLGALRPGGLDGGVHGVSKAHSALPGREVFVVAHHRHPSTFAWSSASHSRAKLPGSGRLLAFTGGGGAEPSEAK